MGLSGRRSKAKNLARLAMKFGLLLTDAKLWQAVNEQLRERADDVRDVLRDKYDDATDRLHDARNVLEGRRDWFTPMVSFLGGVGIGVGLGVLFAPVSGEETRAALRDKATDVRNKVSHFASGATSYGATGTSGD